jgi:hypothetical protein
MDNGIVAALKSEGVLVRVSVSAPFGTAAAHLACHFSVN